MDALAIISIISGLLSLLFLLILHIKSPEYQPNWRMVSEYALGRNKMLLTLFFLLWGLSSITTGIWLLGVLDSGWAIVGIIFVFITGIGAIMGGLFDIKHSLHGLAFGIGIPFLPIGALIIAYQLLKLEEWQNFQAPVLLSSHSIWISVVLMAFSMLLLFSGFKKAGIALSKDSTPPEKLPEGVIGINGYMNRLLIVCYVFWCILISYLYLQTKN